MSKPALQLIKSEPKFYVVKTDAGFYGRYDFTEPCAANVPAAMASCFNPTRDPNAKAQAEAIAARVGGRVVPCFSFDVASEAK